MKKIVLPVIAACAMSSTAFGQVGINTTTPAATLDIVGLPTTTTALDGIIAPRITGDQLRAKTYTTAQDGTLIYVTSADTAPAGQTTNVSAVGYYYFDGVALLWKAFSGGTSVTGNEPWNNQADNTPATSNYQNIYQTGTVAIAKSNNYVAGANLDVNGAVSTGLGNTGPLGINAVVMGTNSSVTTDNSFAAGANNSISGSGNGDVSIATGSNNTISSGTGYLAGYNNTLTGDNGQSSQAYGFGKQNNLNITASSGSIGAFGSGNNVTLKSASGYAGGFGYNNFAYNDSGSGAALAVGLNNIVNNPGGSQGAFAFGTYNNVNGSDALAFGNNNTINGGIAFGKNNNITGGLTFGNSNTGSDGLSIGFSNISNFSYSIALGISASTDKANQLSANFGEYKFTGINPGAATDNVLVINPTTNVLGTISASSLASTEPLKVQSDGSLATLNTQNVYQQGNVAIGKTTGFISAVALDVAGAVRGGVRHSGELDGTKPIGLNSAAFGNVSTAEGQASFAAGTDAHATKDYSVAFGSSSYVNGYSAIAMGSGVTANQSNSVVLGNASKTQESNPGNSGESGGIAIGSQVTVQASNAVGIGSQINANGTSSTAIGVNSTANGVNSVAIGSQAYANADYSTSVGQQNQVTGQYAVGLGVNTQNGSFASTTLGSQNVITTGSANSWVPTDPLLQVGNGEMNTAAQSNALTILKNGNTEIGTHTTAPTSTLQVNGTVSAKLVVISGATLDLNTMSAYSIINPAGNGNVTITLPAASSCPGRLYRVINHDYGGGSVTFSPAIKYSNITASNLDTMDLEGQSGTNVTKVTIQSDGTSWWMIGN